MKLSSSPHLVHSFYFALSSPLAHYFRCRFLTLNYLVHDKVLKSSLPKCFTSSLVHQTFSFERIYKVDTIVVFCVFKSSSPQFYE